VRSRADSWPEMAIP